MKKQLIDYFPPILQQVLDFRLIAQTEQVEFDKFLSAIQTVFNNQFLDDAELNGIERYETILNIIPKGTESLAERRFRIKSRMVENLPFTLPVLKNQLTVLCGEGGSSVNLNAATYTLTVRVNLGVKNQFDAVKSFIDRIAPCNLIIDLSLKYNTHVTLSQFSHAELSAHTHEQLRNEVLSNA